MDDPFFGRGLQRGGDLLQQMQRDVSFRRTFLEDVVPHVHARDVFLSDEPHAVRLADRVDLDDVGMIQPGRRERLLLEATSTSLVRLNVRPHDLDRDLTSQRRLLRQPDLSHPSATDASQQPELAEHLILQIGDSQKTADRRAAENLAL